MEIIPLAIGGGLLFAAGKTLPEKEKKTKFDKYRKKTRDELNELRKIATETQTEEKRLQKLLILETANIVAKKVEKNTIKLNRYLEKNFPTPMEDKKPSSSREALRRSVALLAAGIPAAMLMGVGITVGGNNYLNKRNLTEITTKTDEYVKTKMKKLLSGVPGATDEKIELVIKNHTRLKDAMKEHNKILANYETRKDEERQRLDKLTME